jgi:hypothetical protein
MSRAALKKRITKLELFVLRRGGCTCRSGQQTFYHTAAELEQILNVGCPVHGFRDLGCILWVPSGIPMHPEDRDLCGCPSHPGRDWLAGKRGPLAQQEMEESCGQWQAELSEKARQDFRTQQKRSEELITVYQRRKYAALPR